MIQAPVDHVRGALVTPAIDWLGQLVVERRCSLSDLAPLLPAHGQALLFDQPGADAWVPSSSAQGLVEAVLRVHGGRPGDVLRELGRRTTARVRSLIDAPAERLALRLSDLAHVGQWRRARPLLPGDLVELRGRGPIAPTLLHWIAGLLSSQQGPAGEALRAPRSLGVRPGRAPQVVVRLESPDHAVFVRCVD